MNETAKFTLQMETLMTLWNRIEHLRARIYSAKPKAERVILSAEHDEVVEAIESGLKNAVKLFEEWKNA
jgi:DNA-binding GntR family transcriptional regulator